MGENPEMVFNTGCPSIDLAMQVMKNKDNQFDVFKQYKGVGQELDLANGYIIVLQHPVTTE